MAVELADVDESVLTGLWELAVRDAAPDEVTPPLGGPGWNHERHEWFLAYHRSATGLDGPSGEKSWAVMANGELAGSVRLKRIPAAEATGAGAGEAETGIWLGRSYRGRGIGSAALALVLAAARAAGVSRLSASTTGGNVVAQHLLAAAGATLEPDPEGAVSAGFVL
ncbi:GCN5 family acetyltransferase [Arthrobacter sp. ZBG10]|uniref:GNAT family N-acetyltransferase n=1 Tax=Micrococcaceae TaxID=1268 RepID=UPI00068073EA|nr:MULTISPECIES: GNAT family N-acetyltransferase [Micrococcaceae]KNH18621.1 GCN5 family acetyltransferase [Arthrobacter sp. ZBG10]KQQ98792.1 GCN5 family acetyltransferase [Arthrobacter sp. Leaf141]